VQELGQSSFRGRNVYVWGTWNRDNIQDYSTAICAMEMVSSSKAIITWQWSGKLVKMPLSGTVSSTIVMNVLTGKITEHTDSVNLQGNLVAQLMYAAQKRLWVQKQSAKQLKNKV
jgi:hypothetical protein